MDLTGRVIMLTGGAGAIGRATGEALAAMGASVMVTDLDPGSAAEAAAALPPADPPAEGTGLDVTDHGAVGRAVDALLARHGRLDGAFNAAGIIGPPFQGLDLAPGDWARVIDVTLNGTWFAVQHQARAMRATGRGGSIVNAASVAGLVGAKLNIAYAAAKHGVIGLTRTAALEAAPHRIRVNAVCPNWTEGPMTEAVEATGVDVSPRMAARTPLGRVGRPADTAGLVAWLMTDASAYVTGAAIPVDGGFTAQ
ncbi:MAG: SDR family NAD(P)-dependent oxidoreductase [Pseudomonadota bacterium]